MAISLECRGYGGASVEMSTDMDSNGTGITALVERARNGDQAAFRELLELYARKIHRVIYEHLEDDDAARDLTQDVSCIVWEKLNDLDNPKRFSSWLIAIARNKARKVLRKKKREPEIVSLDDDNRPVDEPRDQSSESDPESALLKKHADMIIRRKIAEIRNGHHREYFRLRYIEGMTVQEIAEEMDVNKETVKKALQRGLKPFMKLDIWNWNDR